MKRRMICVLAAVGMLPALVGCSEKPGSGPAVATTTAITATTTATATTVEKGKTTGTTTASVKSTTASKTTPSTGPLVRDPSLKPCEHWNYKFDDATMTVSGMYKYTSVKLLDLTFPDPEYIDIDEFGFHDFVFLKNGKVVDRGYIEVGMQIRIYHCNTYGVKKFYGEYTVKGPLEEGSRSKEPVYQLGSILTFDPVAKYIPTAVVKEGTSVSEVLKGLPYPYPDYKYTAYKNGKEVKEGLMEEGMTIREYKEYKDYPVPGSDDIHDISYQVVFL